MKKETINELTNDIATLVELCLPELREIVFHSDGRVVAKTGGRAKFPKRLYGARPRGLHDKSALVVDVLQKLYIENKLTLT
jgi:hypothetical protein